MTSLDYVDADTRFAEINARPPEDLTVEEAASLAAAEAMDDGTSMTLAEHKEQREK